MGSVTRVPRISSAQIVDGSVAVADVAADVATQAELDTHAALTVASAVHGLAAQAAYTQTYATAARTHSNPTATVLTSNGASANNALVDVTTATISDPAKVNANFDDVADEVNKLIADLVNVKQVLNSLVDDHQALNLAS